MLLVVSLSGVKIKQITEIITMNFWKPFLEVINCFSDWILIPCPSSALKKFTYLFVRFTVSEFSGATLFVAYFFIWVNYLTNIIFHEVIVCLVYKQYAFKSLYSYK